MCDGTSVMIQLLEKTKNMINVHNLDEETSRMIKGLVVVRISTKHINPWMRQLEMKRKVILRWRG